MIISLFAQAAAAPSANGWLIDPELASNGYGQVMAGGTIQTQFPPPEPPPQPPQWLIDLFNGAAHFFRESAPYLQPMLTVVAAGLFLYLLYRLVPAFKVWVDARLFRPKVQAEDDSFAHAEVGAARALLSEADAMAAQGRFSEAVHLLLYRSVDDIAARRPGLVKPALTSRDLAVAAAIPAVARAAFASIARAVEVSLFGGQPIDAPAWQACRAAYAELAIPQNWAAG